MILQDLPHLSVAVIALVFQIQLFQATSLYSDLLLPQICHLLWFITGNYFWPVQVWGPSVSEQVIRFHRWGSSDLGYSSEWAVDWTSYKQVLNQLDKCVSSVLYSTLFQRYLHWSTSSLPSSTDNTPERRLTSSHTLSSSFVILFSTNNTPSRHRQDHHTSSTWFLTTENTIWWQPSTTFTSVISSTMNFNNENNGEREQKQSNLSNQNEENNNLPDMTSQDYIVIAQNLFVMMGQTNNNNFNAENAENQDSASLWGPTGWHSDKVRYFDLHLDAVMGMSNIVQASRDTYYQNVYLFIDWIKDTASIRGSKIVRSNLSTCLQESAQEWYSFELT